jgi:hypothetical protein
MRRKIFLSVVSALGLGLPLSSQAAIIAQYNFYGLVGGVPGTQGAASSYSVSPNVLAANVTASNITTGVNTTVSSNVDQTYYASQTNPSIMSVESTGSTTDNGYWIQMVFTPAAGYVIDPTSFDLVAGAGGSSNVRSGYIFDDADTPGFTGSPSDLNLATNASSGPTITASTSSEATPLGSANLNNSIRSHSPLEPMTTISGTFSPGDTNLSELTVRVFFDTQGQVDKNIDINQVELDGSIVPVPEPESVGLGLLTGVMACGIRRRRSALAV